MRARRVLPLVGLVCGLISIALTALISPAAGDPTASPGAAGPAVSPIGGQLGEEIPQLRTRTSRTYVDEYGTYTARVFTTPVNYREDGRWHAIDNTLVADPDGFHNRANSYRIDLPRDVGGRATPTSTASGRSRA